MIHHRKEAKSRRWSKQAAVAVGVSMFFALAGPVAQAQTSPEPTMIGPVRLVESPAGLLVGDYVGYSVVILNSKTLAVEDTVPITSKPLSVAWMNGRIYVGDEKTGFIEVYEKSKSTKNKGGSKNKLEWV